MKVPRYENKVGLDVPNVAMPVIPIGDKSTSADITDAANFQRNAETVGKLGEMITGYANKKYKEDQEQQLAYNSQQASNDFHNAQWNTNIEKIEQPDGSFKDRPIGPRNWKLGDATEAPGTTNKNGFEIYNKYIGSFTDSNTAAKFTESYNNNFMAEKNAVVKYSASELEKNRIGIADNYVAETNSKVATNSVQAVELIKNIQDAIDTQGQLKGDGDAIIAANQVKAVDKWVSKNAVELVYQVDPTGATSNTFVDEIKDLSDESKNTIKKKIASASKTYTESLQYQKEAGQDAILIEFADKLVTGQPMDKDDILDLGITGVMRPADANAVIKGMTETISIVKASDLKSMKALLPFIEGITFIKDDKARAVAIKNILEDKTIKKPDDVQLVLQTMKRASDQKDKVVATAVRDNIKTLVKYSEDTGIRFDARGDLSKDYMRAVNSGVPSKDAALAAIENAQAREMSSNDKETDLVVGLTQDMTPDSVNKGVYQYLLKSGVESKEAAQTADQILQKASKEEGVQYKYAVVDAIDRAIPELKNISPEANQVIKEVEQDKKVGEELTKNASNLSFFGNVKESFIRGNTSSKIDIMSYGASTGELDYDTQVKPYKDAFYKELSEIHIEGNIFTNAIYSVANMIPAMGKGMVEGSKLGMTLGAGAAISGQLGPQVATPEELITVPAAYAAGSTAGSMVYWYKQGTGQIYSELKDVGIKDNIAVPVSHIAGSLYGAVEFSQVSRLFPGGKEATKKLFVTSIRKAVATVAKRYGANWAQEVGEEGIQQIIIESSKEISDKIAKRTNKTTGDIFGTIMNAGWGAVKDSALPMLLLTGPRAGVEAKYAADQAKENKAKRDKYTENIVKLSMQYQEKQAGGESTFEEEVAPVETKQESAKQVTSIPEQFDSGNDPKLLDYLSQFIPTHELVNMKKDERLKIGNMSPEQLRDYVVNKESEARDNAGKEDIGRMRNVLKEELNKIQIPEASEKEPTTDLGKQLKQQILDKESIPLHPSGEGKAKGNTSVNKQTTTEKEREPTTDLGKQLKDQGKALENVPLHPAAEGKASVKKILDDVVDSLPGVGLSVEDVSVDKKRESLEQQAKKFKTAEEFIKNVDREKLEVFKQEMIDKGEDISLSGSTLPKAEWREKIFIPKLTDIWNKAQPLAEAGKSAKQLADEKSTQALVAKNKATTDYVRGQINTAMKKWTQGRTDAEFTRLGSIGKERLQSAKTEINRLAKLDPSLSIKDKIAISRARTFGEIQEVLDRSAVSKDGNKAQATNKLPSNAGSVYIGPIAERIASIAEDSLKPEVRENWYQKIVNRFQPIENLSTLAKQLGANVTNLTDPIFSTMSFLSSANQATNIIDRGTYKITEAGSVEYTGEGLKGIVRDYESNSTEQNQEVRDSDLQDYLVSKRTVEDLQRPKREGSDENIVTPAQVAKAEATLAVLKEKYGDEIGNLESTANRLYDFQRRVLHGLVDSGVMSEKQFQNILDKNPNYIPFDRVFEEEQFAGALPTNKSPFSGIKNPIKRILGSDRDIEGVLGSIIKNTYTTVERSNRNKVFKDVYGLKDVAGLGIKAVRPNMVAIKDDNGNTIFRPSQLKPFGNIVEGIIDGKKKYLEVSRNVYESMAGLDESSSNWFVKLMSVPASLLRTGATITPEFITRNPIRDQWTAFIQTNVGFVPFVDTLGAIADITKNSDIYNEWIESGASYAGFVELSRPSVLALVKKLQKDKKISFSLVKNLSDLSQVMEQATRVGVYKKARAKGLSALEAAKESREATLDFSRRGTGLMRDFNSVIPFLNAGIQGTDKMVRTFKKDPIGTTAKIVTSITIPSILLYLRNREEEDYFELPRWRRDLFWNFKAGDNWYSIPKPFGYGQLFGSLPERLMEHIDTKNPNSFKDLGDSLGGSLSPIGNDILGGVIPTVLKPLVENKTNWSFFRERKVVPEYMTELVPSEQYSKYDSETAKVLGEIFNVSPSKLQNLITGWTGGSGKYALQGGDLVVGAARWFSGKTNKEKRPLELTDIPLVKGFAARKPQGFASQSVSDFYDNRKSIRTLHKTMKRYDDLDKSDKSEEIFNKNPEVGLYREMEKSGRDLSKLGKELDLVIEDAKISTKEKRSLISEIENTMVEIAKEMNIEYNLLRSKK